MDTTCDTNEEMRHSYQLSVTNLEETANFGDHGADGIITLKSFAATGFNRFIIEFNGVFCEHDYERFNSTTIRNFLNC
jgi:hypothetical protein